ncbi:hypothetical protein [Sandarakinorhabdus sp.]|uniref:hypothetical protein n=1 Tax=Sandarakinorhabdus sp. TaxID=1916663 RepID=UPI003340A4AF
MGVLRSPGYYLPEGVPAEVAVSGLLLSVTCFAIILFSDLPLVRRHGEVLERGLRFQGTSELSFEPDNFGLPYVFGVRAND